MPMCSPPAFGSLCTHTLAWTTRYGSPGLLGGKSSALAPAFAGDGATASGGSSSAPNPSELLPASSRPPCPSSLNSSKATPSAMFRMRQIIAAASSNRRSASSRSGGGNNASALSKAESSKLRPESAAMTTLESWRESGQGKRQPSRSKAASKEPPDRANNAQHFSEPLWMARLTGWQPLLPLQPCSRTRRSTLRRRLASPRAAASQTGSSGWRSSPCSG
mmetsp:Transcript_58737/g.170400  ORF Transcript_58737/g.170400 Transcript_58737/m.170400 type:complete len:220 (-) Transcript_58737:330-989(-)